jgi:hypothetical protein
MTSLEIGKLVALGGVGWLILSLLCGWAWTRFKRWEREQHRLDLEAWRRQERARWEKT